MAPPNPKQELKRLEETPKWLTDLVAAFPGRLDLHVKVEFERRARLAKLSEATASTRATIAAKALADPKSKKWILWTGKVFEGPEGEGAYRPGDNKCNLFVYEMLALAGVRIPLIEYDAIGPNQLRPPLAGEWANPRYDIPGFEVLTVPPDVPQPGDIAAIAHDSDDATGHVGIVVNSPDGTPNFTVSARFDGVKYENWGFRDKNAGPVVFRRYVGGPQNARLGGSHSWQDH